MEREGEEKEVGRWREEDEEEVLCLCMREASEREEVEEEVERCLEEEEDVLDLGTLSTCAAATEPPI